MERVLSQDERIRRAEEIYARRKMNETRKSATVQVEAQKPNNLTKKLVKQFIICLLIYICFYMAKNVPNLIPQEVMNKITDTLEYDINVQELYENFKGIYKKENQDENVENKEEEQLPQETLSATDSDGESNEVAQKEEKSEETQEEENTEGLTQMEIDARYIKKNYSLIKPLEGEITSRFGPRNPEVPTVPKYHTGIDIARVVGTVVISAMEGTVELVSGEGSYGNHVKITNGDVSTLYAHCSKIYVKEGDYITQGQEIAEVGATGNVTGPHLHFEIRRNNEYVDPDLILEF
jgi:murein DD-endopeptidase MepM/ murein hydrolase activator NlpD